jgi:hypothetical protein
MSILSKLALGSTVSFDVYPAGIIGSSFQDVKVLAILDMDTAADRIDPVALHINVKPTLPPGTPDDPQDYHYLKLKHPNGAIEIIGVPWIREETIVHSQSGTLVITVDNVGPEDRETISHALAANGYHAASVKMK